MNAWIRLIGVLIIFYINLFDFFLNAQSFQYFNRNLSENDKLIGLNLNQNFATNSLTSGFVIDFLKGKFITDQLKDECISNFKNNNLIVGENFNLSLNYQRRLGTGNNFLFFELGETFFYESKMNQDIFVLLFKGNKTFENKTALLNPLSIKSLQYFYFKGGFHRITNQFSIKLNVAYLAGQRFLDLKTERGSLSTAIDGRFLEMGLDLKSYDVNPSHNAFFTNSGSGILSDFKFSYKPVESAEIELGIEGLGVINWNNNVTQRIVDTFYHFDGTEISNVLDSFSIAVKNVEDLKSSFIRETQNVKHQTNLPYIAYVQYSQFLIPEILQVQLKYGIIKSDFTIPFLNSALNYYMTPHKLIGLNLDAGGYGKLNLGGQIAFCFSNKSSIHLFFHSISNLLIPSGEMNFTGGLIYRRAIH